MRPTMTLLVIGTLVLQPILAGAQEAQFQLPLDDVAGEAARFLEAKRISAEQEETADAQGRRTYPMFELYGGFVAAAGGELAEPDDEKGTGAIGWNASFTTSVHESLGITAYVDGLYQRNPRARGTQFYHYLVGPTFRFKGGALQAYNEKWFVHALVGGFAPRGGDGSSSSGLSMRIGLGGDLWGGIRTDLNYVMERFSDDTVHLFSWSLLGIVIPFPTSP